MRSTPTVVTVGTLVGAIDGVAASADMNAGRTWKSPGIGLTGTPVLAWGWAPAVQVGATVIGIGGAMARQEWGLGAAMAGLALFTRDAAFTLAQRRQTAPASAQGYATQLVTGTARGGYGVDDPVTSAG